MLVHVALRKAHDGMHETSVIFLDLAKVFDTVSHEAILSHTKVKCARGMKQGDPLSPMLFILAMDEVVTDSRMDIGISMGGNIVDAIAYTDDLILLADTPKLIDARLRGVNGALKDRGMSLDTSKSAAITITKDKKEEVCYSTTKDMRDIRWHYQA